MATLQNIRKRSGLLIGIVGFAMLAFILTDLLSSRGSVLQRDVNTILEVNGEKISSQQFFTRVQERIDAYIASSGDAGLTQSSRDQFLDLTYDELLRERIMEAQYEELGIQVTSEELWDVIITNPSVTSIQGFQNESGQFDPERIKQYIALLEEQRSTNPDVQTEWENWINFEQQLLDTQIQNKYNGLITKGLAATKLEGQIQYEERNTRNDIRLVFRPYTAINDSSITVSDADIKKYYSANKEDLFEQEEGRDIEYVVFNIQPSEEDVAAAAANFNEMMVDQIVYNSETNQNDTILGFVNTDDDSAFINANSEQSRYFGQYFREGQLDAQYDSLMFANEPGYIYGPYRDGDFYRAVKLIEKSTQPDSVRARHILIAYQGAERAAPEVVRTPQAAQALADSLFEVVKASPGQFADFAAQYSDGPTKTKGGDLDWFQPGTMAANFNNYVFNNEKGDIGLVITQFGFHIIEITDQGGNSPVAKVGVLDMRILPSNETEDRIYAESNSLAGSGSTLEEFRAKAAELGAEVRPATNLRPLDKTVPGLVGSRQIVRWSFNEDNEEGATNIFDLSNQVVVVYLTRIREEGFAAIDDVRAQIDGRVRREKKGEMIKSEMEGATNLDDLAQSLGVQVNTIAGVTFANNSIQGVGTEPLVAAIASGLPLNTLSKPIIGNTGVIMIEVTNRTEATPQENYDTQIQQIANQYVSRVNSEVFETLKSKATIVDNRASFQ